LSLSVHAEPKAQLKRQLHWPELTASEAATLLQRANHAARVLNYRGAYIYQHRDSIESFVITHRFTEASEQERRESLDGVRREFVRRDDEVIFYQTDAKPISFNRHRSDKLFPGIFPPQMVDVLNHYRFRHSGYKRVANYSCQQWLLEPKDNFRHPHKLCIEPESGLLLRSMMFDKADGRLLESFSFTRLELGASIEAKHLQPSLRADVEAKAITEETLSSPLTELQLNWRQLPSGFRLVKEVHRPLPGNFKPASQYLFSDGLAKVSVFIERTTPVLPALKASQGVNYYARQKGNYRIIVLGEVPSKTAKLFAEAIKLVK